MTSSFGRRLAQLGLVVSVAALLILLAAGPGARLGLWHFRTGLGFLRWAAYGGLAGGAIGLVGLVLGGWRAGAALAVILGLVAFVPPRIFQRRARSVPPIHDISTDTQDPPRFVAVLQQRSGASNPAEHGGPEVAAQQRQAYPDITSLTLAEPPSRAFERVREAARELGWEVVAQDAAEGRLEATDTTFWFGFKDDVVVRVRPEGAGSRVDVRSVSRVGRSDVGENARRIRRFLQTLRR